MREKRDEKRNKKRVRTLSTENTSNCNFPEDHLSCFPHATRSSCRLLFQRRLHREPFRERKLKVKWNRTSRRREKSSLRQLTSSENIPLSTQLRDSWYATSTDTERWKAKISRKLRWVMKSSCAQQGPDRMEMEIELEFWLKIQKFILKAFKATLALWENIFDGSYRLGEVLSRWYNCLLKFTSSGSFLLFVYQ